MVFNAPALAIYTANAIKAAKAVGVGLAAAGGYAGAKRLYSAVNGPGAGRMPKNKRVKQRDSKRKAAYKKKNKPQSRGLPSKRFKHTVTTGSGGRGETLRGMSKDVVTTTKKLTFQAKVLKEALPAINRNSFTGFWQAAEGLQKFGQADGLALWDYSQLNAVMPASTSIESRLWIESAWIRIHFGATNTAAPVILSIIDWECKDDCTTALETLLDNSLSAKYSTTVGSQRIPLDLDEADEFNQFIRVVKRRDMVLNPGEQHIHERKINIGKYYNSGKYANLTTPKYVKGFSAGVLVKFQGGIVVDGAALANVTSGTVSLSYTAHTKLVYRLPQGSVATKLVANIGNPLPTGLLHEYVPIPEAGVAMQEAFG